MSTLAPPGQRLADLAIAGDLAGLKAHLVDYPTDPLQRKRWDANNAFIMAAAYGQKETCAYLLDHVTAPYELDHALMFAACNGRASVVLFLLRRGADPLLDDQAALHGALRNNHAEVMALLAPTADRAELAHRIHMQATSGYRPDEWAQLDRLALYATDEECAYWVTWGSSENLPWLHAKARSRARHEDLSRRSTGSGRPRHRT